MKCQENYLLYRKFQEIIQGVILVRVLHCGAGHAAVFGSVARGKLVPTGIRTSSLSLTQCTLSVYIRLGELQRLYH